MSAWYWVSEGVFVSATVYSIGPRMPLLYPYKVKFPACGLNVTHCPTPTTRTTAQGATNLEQRSCSG